MKIGFMRTGLMGSPMSGRLLSSGHGLIVDNRTKAPGRSHDMITTESVEEEK